MNDDLVGQLHELRRETRGEIEQPFTVRVLVIDRGRRALNDLEACQQGPEFLKCCAKGKATYRHVGRHAQQFARFPGVWCHGDYAELTPSGGIVIHGGDARQQRSNGVTVLPWNDLYEAIMAG